MSVISSVIEYIAPSVYPSNKAKLISSREIAEIEIRLSWSAGTTYDDEILLIRDPFTHINKPFTTTPITFFETSWTGVGSPTFQLK